MGVTVQTIFHMSNTNLERGAMPRIVKALKVATFRKKNYYTVEFRIFNWAIFIIYLFSLWVIISLIFYFFFTLNINSLYIWFPILSNPNTSIVWLCVSMFKYADNFSLPIFLRNLRVLHFHKRVQNQEVIFHSNSNLKNIISIFPSKAIAPKCDNVFTTILSYFWNTWVFYQYI